AMSREQLAMSRELRTIALGGTAGQFLETPLTFCSLARMKTRIAILTASAAFVACSSPAPTPAPQPAAAPTQNRPTGPANPSGLPAGLPQIPGQAGDTTQRAGLPAAPQPRPYNRVITAEAKTRRGLFA